MKILMTAFFVGCRLSVGGFTCLLAGISRAWTVDSWKHFTMTLQLTYEVINGASDRALLPGGHDHKIIA